MFKFFAAVVFSAVMAGILVMGAFPPLPARVDGNGNPLFPPQTAPSGIEVAPSAK